MFNLQLSDTNKKDLIEYLKGIYWLLFEASAANHNEWLSKCPLMALNGHASCTE
jgi:hypothetical protein